MALRRLLPARKTETSRDLPGVNGAQLAAALESLTTASTSATWKCRHASGSVLVEGAVDFGARESRATVIRGKTNFEYIRRGSSAFRAPALDEKADPDAKRAWEYASETDACGVHAYAIPEVIAAAVLAAGSLSGGKPEEFGDRKLTSVVVSLKPKPSDPDGRIARLARQLRDHGANVLLVTAFSDPQAAADEGGEDEGGEDEGGGEIGGAPRIERLRLELPHWTPADDPMADHSVTVDLFDLNEPVEIDIPDEALAERRRTARGCSDLALF